MALFLISIFLLLAPRLASGAECSAKTISDVFLPIGPICTNMEADLQQGVFKQTEFCQCMKSIGQTEVDFSLQCEIGAYSNTPLATLAQQNNCYSMFGTQGNTYAVGDRVQAFWANSWWYDARISAVIGPDLYNIVYDDGDTDYGFGLSQIRPLVTETRAVRADDGGYLLHEVVEACVCCVAVHNVGCGGVSNTNYVQGIIRIVQDFPALDSQGKGQYTVETDSGEVYQDIYYDQIRPLVVYVRGDSVDVRQCYWKDASIQNVNPRGEYEVQFTKSGHPGKFPGKSIRLKMIRYKPADFVWAVDDAGNWNEAMVIQLHVDTDTYFVSFYTATNPALMLRDKVPHTEICPWSPGDTTPPSSCSNYSG